MDFLTAMCYPRYDEDNRLAAGPYGRITIGSLYEDQLFLLTAINTTYDPMIWDLTDKNVLPVAANITLAGTLIHESSPGTFSDGKFGYRSGVNTVPLRLKNGLV